MSLMDEIGRDVIVRALTQPQMGLVNTQVGNDENGNPIYQEVPVPVDSIAMQALRTTLKQPEMHEIANIGLNYIRNHPEIAAQAVMKGMVDWLTRTSLYDRSELANQKDIRATFRDVAGAILEDDTDFRARVLDMASLSDSDRIDVNISLKPASGNA